jgi:putative exosortase-associated protein (TIGR04073 family)
VLRSRMFQLAVVMVFAGALTLGSLGAVGQSYDPDQDLPKPTTWGQRVDKLGRGLSNFLFGWAEIPKAWHQGVQYQKPLTEILVTQSLKGFSKALIRTGTGVYEAVTFYTDASENAYEPILEPEYLF